MAYIFNIRRCVHGLVSNETFSSFHHLFKYSLLSLNEDVFAWPSVRPSHTRNKNLENNFDKNASIFKTTLISEIDMQANCQNASDVLTSFFFHIKKTFFGEWLWAKCMKPRSLELIHSETAFPRKENCLSFFLRRFQKTTLFNDFFSFNEREAHFLPLVFARLNGYVVALNPSFFSRVFLHSHLNI